jgi:hypothetical protein
VQHTLTLSDMEWQLLLNLLQDERDELPQEIRHTDNRGVRGQIKERQQLVEQLLERMQHALAQ